MAILKLPPETRSQLLAQFTIDTLPSAVRELLQNSIDAGATDIEIRLDLISFSVYVQDNGTGIAQNELEFVGKRYYTSKACNNIASDGLFGFRGEALHLLSTSTRTTIVSKTKGNNTYVIRKKPEFFFEAPLLFEYNDEVANAPESTFHIALMGESGTVVCAHNLFSPLRRKILSEFSEERIISELKDVVFLSSLMANVTINVSVLNPNLRALDLIIARKILPSEVPHAFFDIFRDIYGSQALPQCQTLTGNYKDFSLNGVIGTHPSYSRRFQFVFINGKLASLPDADSRTITSMFSDARFGSLGRSSPSKRSSASPVFIINFTTPKTLQGPLLCHSEHHEWPTMLKMLLNVLSSFLNVSGFQYTLTPQTSPQKRRRLDGPPRPGKCLTPRITLSGKDETKYVQLHLSKEDLAHCTVIRQLERKFILVTVRRMSRNSLVVLDQHACDERIRLEEMLRGFILLFREEEANLRQKIGSKIEIELPMGEVSVLLEYKKELHRLGIDFFSEGTILTVTHLPEILQRTSPEALRDGLLQFVSESPEALRDGILQYVSEGLVSAPGELDKGWFSIVAKLPRMIIEAFNSRACRSAVMFGDELLADEMAYLVKGLSQCILPFQCAHGRPTVAPIAELRKSDQ